MTTESVHAGRHASRWGRAFITATTADPWSLRADLVVLPVGPNPLEASGYWVRALDKVHPELKLEKAVPSAFMRKAESSLRVLESGELRLLLVPTPAPGIGGQDDLMREVRRITRLIVIDAENMGARSLALPLLDEEAGDDANQVAKWMFAQLRSQPPPVSLRDVILVGRTVAALAGIGAPPVRAQAFSNDGLRGDDLLDTETEVSALAEMLLLRDLEPPIVLGVLGGWGSGKSFAMRLVADRMRQIRCLSVAEEHAWPDPGNEGFAYVGHVYTVHFDAWTYAKSDLWASLMQTILSELERQLTLEEKLAEIIIPGDRASAAVAKKRAEVMRGAGRLWGVLAELDDRARDRILESELGKDILEQLYKDPAKEDPAGALWHELQRRTEQARTSLKKSSADMSAKKRELERLRAQLKEEVEREEAWLRYKTLLKHKAGPYVARVKAMIDGKESETLGFWERIKAIPRMFSKRPGESALVIVVAIVVWVGLTLIGDSFALPDLEKLLASGLGSFGTGFFMVYLRTASGILDEIEEHYREFEKIRREVAAVDDEAKRLRLEEKLRENKRIPALQKEIGELEAKIDRAKRELVFPEYRSLSEFVRARIDDGVYDAGLGLLHTVQRDLEELSHALSPATPDSDEPARKMFPRGPARVALFIDDLDRCPPEKVVEVLEATQLLLKTRLFVVVLALDVRFVSRSLEKEYSGVLSRHGAPSGLDYIEKIIQIPYRVRPVSGDSFRTYLAAQIEVESTEETPRREADAPRARTPTTATVGLHATARRRPTDPVDRLLWQQLPSDVLRFSKEEEAFLHKCGNELDLTPRSAKRLINVCKALKIVWHRDPQRRPDRPAAQAVIAFLALSCGFPTVMREVYAFIEAEEFSSADMRLREVVANLREATERTAYQDQLWMRAAANARNIFPDLRVSMLDPASLELARAFSFVGDVGYDPADAEHSSHFDPEELVPAPKSPNSAA